MRLLVAAALAVLIPAMPLSLTASQGAGAAVPVASARPGSAPLAPVDVTHGDLAPVDSTRGGAAAVDRAHGDAAPLDARGRRSSGIAVPPTSTAATQGPGVATGSGAESPQTTRLAPSGAFAWPLSPQPAVLRRFEPPLSQWSAGHRGVDLRAAVDQPVLSAGAGVVAFSGVIAGRGVITVRHSGGMRTTYEPVDERLEAGTVVHRGAPIGLVSHIPGHCAPVTCLHWGVISGQSYLDPLSLLGFGHPILLPLG